jgi:hypothetical protein
MAKFPRWLHVRSAIIPRLRFFSASGPSLQVASINWSVNL